MNENKHLVNLKVEVVEVLITSDLFARGIDVQQVSIVINFDVPKANILIYTELDALVDGVEKELLLTLHVSMILTDLRNLKNIIKHKLLRCLTITQNTLIFR